MPVVSTGQLTIVDVNDGVDGLDGPALSINASKAGFTFQDGVAVPAVQAIAFNAKRQGLTGDVVWSASDGMTFDSDDGALDLTGFALGYPATGDGDTVYLDLSDFGALRQGTVAASVDGLTSFYNVLRIDKSTAQANATRNVFVGNWAAGTSYLIGDVVLRDGYGWSCLQDHVSSISITPPTAPSTSNAYWTIYAVKGDTGIRGTITTAKAVAGSSWVDADADTAITEAGGGIPIQGDVVTLYNSAASYSQTRVRSSGGTWTALTAFFGGNVLVDGTITATKLAANSIAVGTAAIQNGAIVNAMISDATIESAKIAGLSVTKLTAGSMQVGSYIRSSDYQEGVSGWEIAADGTAKFNNVLARGNIQATSGSIVGASISNALSGQRIVLDNRGLLFLTGASSGKYSTFKYGAKKYGSGVLVYFNSVDKKVPFYVSAEQNVADIHLYNRGANPTGATYEDGDMICVNGRLKIYVSALGGWKTVALE